MGAGNGALLSGALAALAFIGGCTADTPADPSLFPLNSHWLWTYRVTRVDDQTGLSTLSEFQVRNTGASTTDNEVEGVERTNSLGNRYYFKASETGIVRTGVRNLLERKARHNEQHQARFVLRYPIESGTQWSALTRPYLLKRHFAWPRELWFGEPVLMDFRILRTDAEVKVPAGQFSNCTMVVGEHVYKLYPDPNTGANKAQILQHEWYCPAVGLVRLARTETVRSSYYTGGSQTFELLSLQQ